MKRNPQKHHRRSIQLKDYDYSQAGAYFVTICTHKGQCIWGKVINGEMRLNEYGRVVEAEWLKTAKIRDNVELDEFLVMPNHFHAIILIIDIVGATRWVARATRLQSRSLGSIIGQFKSIVTKRIHKMGLRHFKWQRNYYEHIIRDEHDLNKIREYIVNNPITWELDDENPENIKRAIRRGGRVASTS